MKGKTGKPAMRGGGMARKGVGAALKGGGMARKGTGSNATPGGKKLAGGGFAGNGDGGGRGDMGRPNMGRPNMVRPGFPVRPGVGRPGMSGGKGGPGSGATIQQTLGSSATGPKTVVNPSGGGKPNTTGLSAGPMDQLREQRALDAYAAANYGAGGVKTPGMPRPTYNTGIKKDGGKVSKYAKGGAVKMTAGAGSGSGRLEKVANHKGAKRVPAANLKSGGKVKGK